VEKKPERSRTSFRAGPNRAGALSTTRGLAQRHLWIIPVLTLITLVVAGLWVRGQIEEAIQEQTAATLTTVLRADVEALSLWMRIQEDNAAVIAGDPVIRKLVLDLLDYSRTTGAKPAQLDAAPQQAALAAELKPWVDRQAYTGYVVFNLEGLILATDEELLLGRNAPKSEQHMFARVLAGRPTVSHPFASRIMLPGPDGEPIAGVPVMFVAAPVMDADDKPVAVVALRIDPAHEFSEILSVAQPGATGETYAFNEQGVFLSRSRFDEQLKEIALLPDQPHAQSVLNVELRNPGVDMTTGARSAIARAKQPLTALAADAIQRKPEIAEPGVDVVGHLDYRGVPSVGAWVWLPEFELGVATEMDLAEAYRPVFALRFVFWVLFGLLTALAALLLALTLLAGRLDRKMRDAVIAAGQLGQYALEQKIGEGGMGSVYRARHALLRRPTAVKLLEPSRTTDVSVARFEREVQLTSQLNHPNTITIYDYGRTAEGVFYYAMEFLDGYPLDVLVRRFGPLPDGRVINILMQVCGSLSEAHAAGLMHRDIKPANIMVTARGGVYDFVKLLDFGLVKAIDSHKMQTLTAVDTVTGTPLYMAPETIRDADGCDARGDLYALGAVGYFLLTGHAVFESSNVLEIMRAHVEAQPVPPSERAGRPISRSLEAVILQCLAKSPSDRPQSAAELLALLEQCVPLEAWNSAKAAAWWHQNQETREMPADSAATIEHSLGVTQGYSGGRSGS
jgi:hypothetical protein